MQWRQLEAEHSGAAVTDRAASRAIRPYSSGPQCTCSLLCAGKPAANSEANDTDLSLCLRIVHLAFGAHEHVNLNTLYLAIRCHTLYQGHLKFTKN